MLQSAFKLFCAGMAVLGPFAAGSIQSYVANSEASAFFMCAGVLLGIAGLVGFAGVERDEQRAHDRARFGRKL